MEILIFKRIFDIVYSKQWGVVLWKRQIRKV